MHLKQSRNEIVDYFQSHGRSIFKLREIEKILAENRADWGLPSSFSAAEFLAELLKTKRLRELAFDFPHRKETRYVWGDVPLEVVLLTLKPKCHFCHFTAMQLHDLTEQSPTTYYLNHELRPLPASAGGLEQSRLDRAFQNQPRMTKNIATTRVPQRGKIRVCLLNGKHTGYLGVVEREMTLADGTSATLRVTDLERTLIDIVVRPFYAGGVAEVLNAYRAAAGRISVNRLAATLRKLGYLYPYHQAVGYYLEACRQFDEATVALFHDGFDYEFDFYLTYKMGETEYVPRWRIHVPSGLTPRR
ncbi:MAG: hypothetical protein AB7N71_12060 [Phycisphaerae bacterium]